MKESEDKREKTDTRKEKKQEELCLVKRPWKEKHSSTNKYT